MKFPFVWFSISNREEAEFQKQVLDIAKPEGILSSISELGQGKAKEQRSNLIKNASSNNILLKMDSGGFSFYRENISPDPVDVIKEQLKYNPNVVIQLDRPIHANLSPQSRIENIEYTINNIDKVSAYIDEKKYRFVPTIHGFSQEELKLSISGIKKSGFDPKIISIGSLVPMLTSRYGGGGFRNRAFEIIKTVRQNFPEIPIHVLGAGGALTPILMGLGVNSIDSTGWIKKAAFGCINFKGTSDRFFYTDGFKKHAYRTGIFDDPDSRKKWQECSCNMCNHTKQIYHWDTVTRFHMYSRKNLTSQENKDARRLRATHNMSIQLMDIIDARNAIINNKFEEYLQKRLENSIYRKLAESLFEIIIPRAKSINQFKSGQRYQENEILKLQEELHIGKKLAKFLYFYGINKSNYDFYIENYYDTLQKFANQTEKNALSRLIKQFR
ncbi:MAG: hypothetical protein INQ03_06225 [Candidatus Heimdallarchaeota archaeon]|nr:hypothetical protein [Candidatus Heimdallarchaeota archaeon]